MSRLFIHSGPFKPQHSLVAVGLLAALNMGCERREESIAPATSFEDPAFQEAEREFAAFEATKDEWEKTVWRAETRAARFGEVITDFWDSLNQAADAWQVVARLQFADAMRITPRIRSEWVPSLGLFLWDPADDAVVEWSMADWRRVARQWKSDGWGIKGVELRHVGFDYQEGSETAISTLNVRIHLTQVDSLTSRWALGPVSIEWSVDPTHETPAGILNIDASELTFRERVGASVFEPRMESRLTPPKRSHFVDPMIVRDIDNDGDSEIILAAANTIFRNRGAFEFETETFLSQPLNLMSTGILDDFDGDGRLEYLGFDREGAAMFRQDSSGKYSMAPTRVWRSPERIEYGMAISAGDIDKDGDLDVWMGQYKLPYLKGQMPTPVWDANDGYPDYLLENLGDGRFRDITERSGLAAKRFRRVYAGALVDIDTDGDLDLYTISDFAGLDIYLNDGRGRFDDRTDQIIGSRHGHGMSSSARDWDRDGALDILMIGMGSAAATRMDAMELHAPTTPEEHWAKRSEMTYGNRLFLGDGKGGFTFSETRSELLKTGWAWAAPALDLENDGDLDLFVANGHESRQFTSDYERHFWLYDIHFGTGEERTGFESFVRKSMSDLRGGGQSYGGYHFNRFLLNDGASAFRDIGVLIGLGSQVDCRGAIAEDFDLDGRMDLAVTTAEVWPEPRQRLLVFRNRLEDVGAWIGLQIPAVLNERPTTGATVILHTDGAERRLDLLAGEAYRSQGSHNVHFGLGSEPTETLEATIRIPGGAPLKITDLKVNQWNPIE